jgi:DNA-binding ferritin-like protein
MNIVTKLLTFQNQIKILHWQTTSYSEHKSLDGLYSDLSGHIDEFVETFMGKYGRIISESSFNFKLENYKNMAPQSLLTEIENYLINELPTMLDSKKDTDLLNIRDEMLGSVNQTKYLLTLK